jgi:predicted RecA/RadA family phage recombinase
MTVARYTDAYRGPGETLDLVAPSAVDGGKGLLVGGIFGVARGDIASGDSGPCDVEGEFNLTAKTSQAWSVGDVLYWDNTLGHVTSDGSKGPRIGVCSATKASAASTGSVRLDGLTKRVLGITEGTAAATSDATAGAKTITAAELLTGVYVRDCNGAGRTDTLPTAALLVAAIPGAKVGDMLKCLFVNGSDAAEALTLAAGTGGAFDTNQTAASRVVAQNSSKVVHIRLTNVTAASEAYVVYA